MEAQPRMLGRAIGALLVITAVTCVFAAVAPLRRQALDYRRRISRRATTDTELFAQKSGAGRGFETLPALVQAMADVLAREKLETYWVNPELTASGQLWQRVVEGNWPRLPRSTARAVFRPLGTSRDPSCRIVRMPTVSYELAICP
jgi:hypothetical protein